MALGVALVDPSQDGLLEPSELVTSLGPDLAPEIPPGGLDGELPAGARPQANPEYSHSSYLRMRHTEESYLIYNYLDEE